MLNKPNKQLVRSWLTHKDYQKIESKKLDFELIYRASLDGDTFDSIW